MRFTTRLLQRKRSRRRNGAEMICKKDVEDGKPFWTAATAARIILPNGVEGDRPTYSSTGWYLLNADDEYWIYTSEEIGRIVFTPGSRMTAYPVGGPYAIYDKSKYEYELEHNTLFIKEKNSIEHVENPDNVSHPQHYADGWSNGAEVIDLAEHLSFCAGNVVKYVCRAGRKDPVEYVEDLEKARWYLDHEITRVKRN